MVLYTGYRLRDCWEGELSTAVSGLISAVRPWRGTSLLCLCTHCLTQRNRTFDKTHSAGSSWEAHLTSLQFSSLILCYYLDIQLSPNLSIHGICGHFDIEDCQIHRDFLLRPPWRLHLLPSTECSICSRCAAGRKCGGDLEGQDRLQALAADVTVFIFNKHTYLYISEKFLTFLCPLFISFKWFLSALRFASRKKSTSLHRKLWRLETHFTCLTSTSASTSGRISC